MVPSTFAPGSKCFQCHDTVGQVYFYTMKARGMIYRKVKLEHWPGPDIGFPGKVRFNRETHLNLVAAVGNKTPIRYAKRARIRK